MKRPWQVWLLFVLCLAVVVPAMVWLSVQALKLDEQVTLASRQADLEEDISLALWRMDVAMTPLVAQEAARPYVAYQSFLNPSVAETKDPETKNTEALKPSPLLTQPSQFVRLHFQMDEGGQVTSPQIPPVALMACAIENGAVADEINTNCSRLEDLHKYVAHDQLLAMLPETNLPPAEISRLAWDNRDKLPNLSAGNTIEGQGQQLIANDKYYYLGSQQEGAQAGQQGGRGRGEQQTDGLDQEAINEILNQQTRSDEPGQADQGSLRYARIPQNANAQPQMAADDLAESQQEKWLSQYGGFNNYGRAPRSQNVRGDREFQRRNRALQTYTSTEVVRQRVALPADIVPPVKMVSEGVSAPVWMSDELLLARRVEIDSKTVIQGVWFDWPKLKEFLLAEGAGVSDADDAATLPAFDLRPVSLDEPVSPARQLATLPVQIVVPELTAATTAGMSPIEIALVIAWICLLLATAAVAILLKGVVTLSERRGAFVSAVTHELRTPLTTFRMYAEMLSEGMVKDESQRQTYADTLRVEADRLYHLVENVLSYARLERGRQGGQKQRLTLGGLLERITPRLSDRADQAEMRLDLQVDDSLQGVGLHTDPQAVEQILFNLVDNACKYAATAEDRRIELTASTQGRNLKLQVKDHGPGVSDQFARQMFQPFSKSCEQAAVTAPGVGLGLALCRRQAHELGGSLDWQPSEEGAAFTLTLPTTE